MMKLLSSTLALAFCLLGTPVHSEPDRGPINGHDAYQANCQTCHGPVNDSNEPFYPMLVERAKRLTPTEFIGAVMNGRFGRANDFASHQSPTMPALDYLPNEEIAQIVRFLYAEAGIAGVTVTTEQVAAVRGSEMDEDAPIILTKEQYETAERQYFELCAGCHGIDRYGLSGSALDDISLRSRSPRELMESIHYGTPWGMPNWGTMEQLSAEHMSQLARYLKLPGRKARPFTMADISESWQVLVKPKDRPRRRQFAVAPQDLFVSLLHDSGQVALLDGNNHKLLHTIDTDLAPHDIDISADGRYLYVNARGGQIALIDLFMETPAVVARIRVGYESRNIAVTQNRRNALLAAGNYSQPQVVLMDALTLRPLKLLRLDDDYIWSGDATTLQITAVNNERRFLIIAGGPGGLFDVAAQRRGKSTNVQLKRLADKTQLGRGSFDLSNRYFIMPSDDGDITAYDTQSQVNVASVPIPAMYGSTSGVRYVDPTHGPVWATSAVGSAEVIVIGTDPERHPESAWRVLHRMALPGGGSLHSTTHPDSSHLWLDLTMSGSRKLSGAAIAIDHQQNNGQVRMINLRAALAPEQLHMRAIQPQFNRDGSEVWYTLWNRQDLESAIVVINDETMELTEVIKNIELITPIRTYSVAALLRR